MKTISHKVLCDQGFRALLKHAGSPNDPQTTSGKGQYLVQRRFNNKREYFAKLVIEFYPELIDRKSNSIGEVSLKFDRFFDLVAKFIP